MSLNEKDLTLSGNKGVDPYPGIANPTACSTHADSLEANLVRRTHAASLVTFPVTCD